MKELNELTVADKEVIDRLSRAIRYSLYDRGNSDASSSLSRSIHEIRKLIMRKNATIRRLKEKEK